jgi:hypothetical protein
MAHYGLLRRGGGVKMYASRRVMNSVKSMEKICSNIEMKQEESLSRDSMR